MTALLALLLGAAGLGAETLSTAAGTGVPGYGGDGGAALAAQFNEPAGLAFGPGGELYVSDRLNHCVRVISPTGQVYTLAGNGTAGYAGDGLAPALAQLCSPTALALDDGGNLYIADTGNHRVRVVSGGLMGTAAGSGTPGYGGDNGPPAAALLNGPRGLAFRSGSGLFIADTDNHRLRRVSAGSITTYAGTGVAGTPLEGYPALTQALKLPWGLAFSQLGNLLFAEAGNHGVAAVASADLEIRYTCCGGPASFKDGGKYVARLNTPLGLAVDAGNNVYIADSLNHRVRVYLQERRSVHTAAGNGAAAFAGDGGKAYEGSLNRPEALAFDAQGNLYIADTGNHRIRKVDTPVFHAPPDGFQAVVTTYPNPFRRGQHGQLMVSFTPAATARIRVYDRAGDLLMELPPEIVEASRGLARWDGRGPGGQPLAPGLYFAVAELEGAVARTKFTVAP